MNVKQLIEILQKLPETDKVIIVKSSGEGSPLSSIDDGYYEAETTWYGNIIHPDDAADHAKAEKVVILSPVN